MVTESINITFLFWTRCKYCKKHKDKENSPLCNIRYCNGKKSGDKSNPNYCSSHNYKSD
jgi:hypothetical protein